MVYLCDHYTAVETAAIVAAIAAAVIAAAATPPLAWQDLWTSAEEGINSYSAQEGTIARAI